MGHRRSHLRVGAQFLISLLRRSDADPPIVEDTPIINSEIEVEREHHEHLKKEDGRMEHNVRIMASRDTFLF